MCKEIKYHRIQLMDGYIDIPYNHHYPVIKSWTNNKFAENEFSSLKFINSIFKEELINSWIYKTVVPYKVIDNKLFMQKATGSDFRDYILNNPQLSIHAGIWLALYHNKTLSDGKIRIFGDYSPNNIMIDLEHKIVQALDPGNRCGEEGYPEIDIIKYLLKVTIYFISNIKTPFASIKSFLLGYQSHGKHILDIKKFDEAYYHNLVILRKQWKKKHMIKRILLNIIITIMSIYLKYIIKISVRRLSYDK